MAIETKEPNMSKLLAAYRTDKTLRNACAIRSYERKHPMCVCMLDGLEMALLNEAIAHSNRPE